ncbi:hypothetical protein ACR42A_35345 [Burkholderia gladioli]|uniref:hypothetical protein n=1 Tax=Burkholderia gladioli TaxID=28095 RepID=UPI00163F5121|nr:hypothetical protein [Burkholderia gladioli]
MADPKRARHDRMKLRYSQDMKDGFDSLYVLIEEILRKTASSNNASCTVGELQAASRYLTKYLAEYSLRKRKGIPDARYDPEDEIYWREDRALKGDWAALTGFPDGSREQEVMRQTLGEPSTEKIKQARTLRAEVKESLGGTSRKEGGPLRTCKCDQACLVDLP